MGITLSHASALYVTRMLRSRKEDVRAFDHVPLCKPSTWVGKRWNARAFDPSMWPWQTPTRDDKLDILVDRREDRIRMQTVRSHVCTVKLPPDAILWVDEHMSMVSPPLLFAQMAEVMSLPALVLLGYELCGHFSRCPDDPLGGPIVDDLPSATDVDELRDFLNRVSGLSGARRAREALAYVNDDALSAPEALLGTFCSLPASELGYSLGQVDLNHKVRIEAAENMDARHRYPDLMFSFAPVGINYDGEDHLDLRGLVDAARQVERVNPKDRIGAVAELDRKMHEVRAKLVDDIRRDRDLASEGLCVFRVTKEDITDERGLDKVIRRMLSYVRNNLGIDTTEYEAILDDTELSRDRNELLASFWPHGRGIASHREVM